MSTTTYQYPGLGLSIRHWPPLLSGSYSRNESPFYPLGSHPNVPGSASVLLPMREVAMMAIMDRLTDKPDWNRKVFDVDIVNKWKSESMAVPDSEWMSLARGPGCPDWDVKGWGIMSEEAFDFVSLLRLSRGPIAMEDELTVYGGSASKSCRARPATTARPP